jgi:hypothetical protein
MKKRRMGTHCILIYHAIRGPHIIVDRAACGPQAAILMCHTHCMLHKQILDFKHFRTSRKVLQIVMKVLNYVKTRCLEAIIFAMLCEEKGVEYNSFSRRREF